MSSAGVKAALTPANRMVVPGCSGSAHHTGSQERERLPGVVQARSMPGDPASQVVA
jgi:hypothetical protein